MSIKVAIIGSEQVIADIRELIDEDKQSSISYLSISRHLATAR